jgi:hypothetical protein
MTASADTGNTNQHWLESTDILALAFVILFAVLLLHSATPILASTNNSAGDVDAFHVYAQLDRRCEWRARMEFCYWVKTGTRSRRSASSRRACHGEGGARAPR